MPRPLGIEYPVACYHFICRGNPRFTVFEEERDKQLRERMTKVEMAIKQPR